MEIGEKHNMLICVRKDTEKDKRYYIFRCDCGKEKSIIASNVKNGATKSCGCRKNIGNTKHGGKGTRIYRIWKNMRERCHNPNGTRASIYYYKGIKICKEWDDFLTFRNWAIENGYNSKLTLDRIDNDGNYEPSNCRWVTYLEQANNTSQCKPISYKGKVYTSYAAAERFFGIKTKTISRLKKNNYSDAYIIDTYKTIN